MFAAYGRNTQAGIDRIASGRKPALPAPRLAQHEPIAKPAAAKPLDTRTPLAKIHDEIAEIGRGYGVTLEEILGPRQYKSIVVARHKAILVIAEAYPSKSLPEIGRIFNRNHTSILHVLQKEDRR